MTKLVNSNAWNRVRYTVYAPFYDRIIRVFDAARKRAIDLLELRAGERVLIVGAGTGEDLRYLPHNVDITATDITPAMVEQIQRKAASLQSNATATVMDGQALTFPSEHFDAVVLNLIVAVIPDPQACMREAARVLKASGRIIVFDKFLDDRRKPSLLRRLFNIAAQIAATNLNRQLLPIATQAGLRITHEEPVPKLSRLGFKIALLQKHI